MWSEREREREREREKPRGVENILIEFSSAFAKVRIENINNCLVTTDEKSFIKSSSVR